MREAEIVQDLSATPRIPSDKHDVLFSKARYILNRRHIKRPWFNLNPFLEKTDESADLENWFPGDSKYIQPLESLVLCETFLSEQPVDTRELTIDSFFPYLLSEEWNKGCSIRIMEGQLLDQLLVGLYRMEREQYAVRHTTHAFARNSRPRTGCYKHKDNDSYGSIDETLLLEFAHFGRLTKDRPNPKTLHPFEYLENLKSDDNKLPEIAREIEKFPELPPLKTIDRPRNRAMSLEIDTVKRQNPKLNWGRRATVLTKHINAVGFIAALSNKRQSVAVPVLPEIKRQTTETTSSHPHDRRQTLATTHLPEIRRQSVCTAKQHFERRRESVRLPTIHDHCVKRGVSQTPEINFLDKVNALDLDEDLQSDDDESTKDDDDKKFVQRKLFIRNKRSFMLAEKRQENKNKNRLIIRKKIDFP